MAIAGPFIKGEERHLKRLAIRHPDQLIRIYMHDSHAMKKEVNFESLLCRTGRRRRKSLYRGRGQETNCALRAPEVRWQEGYSLLSA
jgi:hypothetical protein